MIKILFYIILFVLLTFITVMSIWAVFKLWKASSQLLSSIKHGVIAQYKHWREPKPKAHNIPFLTTARKQLNRIQTLRETIETQWLDNLDEAIDASEELLILCERTPEQAERVRRFFKVTLESLEQLTLGLHDIQTDISAADSTQAMGNILMIRDEARRNMSLLKRKRHFDFQVMMETIKQRHK